MTSTKDGLNLKEMNQWALISFTLLGFIIGYGLNEVIDGASSAPSDSGSPTIAANPTPTPSAPRPAGAALDNPADADDDAFLGKKNAPVTLIEFTDYQCPFCSRHATQTSPQIIKEYVDTGKVKYVLRDFPLGFHSNAQKAAEATECADDQGKFWEMHDKLFENTQALDVASLKSYASALGLNSSKFDDCLDSGKYEQEVKDDMADGQASGITGTPGFVILDKKGKGTKLSGAQPFAKFKEALDAAL